MDRRSCPFCNTGVAWTDNLLVTEARWGDGVRVGDWAWGSQPGFLIRAYVVWCIVVPACLAYLPSSPLKNVCGTARRIWDARLWENRLAQAKNVFYAHHIDGDERVNWSDDDWDDLWDELSDQ